MSGATRVAFAWAASQLDIDKVELHWEYNVTRKRWEVNAYRKERLEYLDRMLNDGQPARQSIERFFRQGVAHGVESTNTYGCMTANEAVELGPHDVDVQQLVAADFQAVEDAFAQALARGQADGSIANCDDPRKLARFLTVGFQGLQVMARARSERARLDDTVTVMMVALD